MHVNYAQVVQLELLSLWSKVLNVLPDIIGALIIIILGFIIAPLLGLLVKRVIDVLRVDDVLKKLGVHDVMKDYSDKFSFSTFIGKLVKWFFALAFIMAASEVLGWYRVTDFLNEIIFYIPQVLVAIVILLLAIIAGNFFETVVTRSISGSKAPVNKPEILGVVTRWAIVIFGVLAALFQLGVAPSLIGILFAGIVLALALAFGLGGRKKAEEILDHLKIK
jgi:hypothetical protein